MIDLAEAGHRLAGWDAGEPTDLAVLRGRAQRRRLRRRVAVGGVAAMAVAAAVTMGVLVPGSGPTPVQVGPAKQAPFPALPLPPLPKGWNRVYAGPVALASPAGGAGVPRGGPIELCGPQPPHSKVGCAITDNTTPRAAIPVVVARLHGRPGGSPRTIDGLRVFVSGSGQHRSYAVPALGVRIETFGALGRRIAATLAPSPAMVVASNTTAPTVPTTWRTVHYGAVTLSVPPSWPVDHLTQFPNQAGSGCSLFYPAQLDLGNPSGQCDGTSNGPQGLWLGRSVAAPAGLTHTTLAWVDGAHVDLAWARDGFSNLANLTIRTAHGVTHATVALGDDPSTIERVLASIRATGNSVPTAAAAPAPLRVAATSSSGFIYRLSATPGCVVSDGITLVRDVGTTPLQLGSVHANIRNLSAPHAITYRLVAVPAGSTTGEVAASSTLAKVDFGQTLPATTGQLLAPVAKSHGWYDIVAKVRLDGPQPTRWEIDRLTIDYRYQHRTVKLHLPQRVELPAAPRC